MRVVGEDLVSHRIDIFSIIVLRKVEFDQLAGLHRRAIDGIRSMLLQPGEDICEVEGRSIGRADWMLERLQGQGTKVEGESS